MKLLKGLCIVALMIAFTIPVYAETQSIKLSGDLIMRYIGRDDYDFDDNDRDRDATDGHYFMTNAEVQLDADLTDNVSATIRVVNQRDWNAFELDTDAGDAVNLDEDEFDVMVDLAYVTLKEFFFTPLTVRIGRQDLWFGKGFIIGANYQDPHNAISSDEFTSITSFDAIRGTWDFEPWTLDAVFAQIDENNVRADDDILLYGANLGCVLDYYNAEVETYYWFRKDKHMVIVNALHEADNRIHCIGLRGSFDPHEDITLWGEGAIQAGRYFENVAQDQERNREACAVDVGAEFRLWEEQYAWRPVIGAEYIFYSGHDIDRDHLGNDYHGWDRMYRGKVDSAIHEWYNVLHITQLPTAERADQNLHQFILMGSVQPMDNLTVDARYINFHLDKQARLAIGEKEVGNEVDLELTYEYTEDVTFGLLSAWFWSGDYYIIPEHGPAANAVNGTQKAKDVASEFVATCKVAF